MSVSKGEERNVVEVQRESIEFLHPGYFGASSFVLLRDSLCSKFNIHTRLRQAPNQVARPRPRRSSWGFVMCTASSFVESFVSSFAGGLYAASAIFTAVEWITEQELASEYWYMI